MFSLKKRFKRLSRSLAFTLFCSPFDSLSRYILRFFLMGSNVPKRVDLRRRVYALIGQMKKIDVVKHFQTENIPRSTIYRIIKRFEDGLPCEDKPRKGRPSKLDKKKQRKLKDYAENRVGVSQKTLAKKFYVSRSCIQRNLNKLGLKYYKRQRAPKYNSKELAQIPSKCRKLRRNLRQKGANHETFIIIDDEKYFTFSGDNMPGNAGFYSGNKRDTPPDVKFKCKEKFAPKVMVWLALSSKGISTPYIGTTKGPAINSNVYIEKCLPNLITFINNHHQHDDYVFWPDLATSHYAKTTIEWLNEQKIPFVPKCINPPNVPKARPIEDFWSILADKVYKGGWTAKDEKQLTNRIKAQLKKIDLKVVQTMMNGVRGKLRKIEEQGPFSIL
jgi:transposase